MRRIWHQHGLTIVAVGLFLLTLGLMLPAGWLHQNEELASHGQAAQPFLAYLASPDCWEALTENWESEFLQMGLFVLLSSWLYQRGSSESNDPDAPDDAIEREREAYGAARRALAGVGSGGGGGQAQAVRPEDIPWPVRRGGLARKLYGHSLSIVMLALFAACLIGHAYSGAALQSEEQLRHGGQAIGPWAYMLTPHFWFESMQNWQSEFLAVACLTVLSIFLRERYSPQSKPVAAPHSQTGE